MHKYITRTLFALAMLALAVNNGLDIWQKLKPDKVVAVDPVAVPVVAPMIAAPAVALDQVGRVPEPILRQMVEPVAQNPVPVPPAIAANPVAALPAEKTADAVSDAVVTQAAAGAELSPLELAEAGKLLMTAVMASVPTVTQPTAPQHVPGNALGLSREPFRVGGNALGLTRNSRSESNDDSPGFALRSRWSLPDELQMIQTSQSLGEKKPAKESIRKEPVALINPRIRGVPFVLPSGHVVPNGCKPCRMRGLRGNGY